MVSSWPVRRLPLYAWIGLAVMVTSEAAMLARLEPFWTFHTPIVWTGYILLADGLVWRRRGTSWIRDYPAELLFLAVFSVPLWLVFEGYNLLIENWHYVGLPEHPLLRGLGYAWSFATIWPAIFETGDLVASLRDRRAPPGRAVIRECPSRLGWAGRLSVATGAALLLWPILWPSPYLAAPVWLGFIFLLDPLNRRLGAESLFCDFGSGRFERAINLGVAGLACGLLWEFWNYWARAKWVYTVPILPEWKLFEMPILGYLGFPAFALECFTMYVTLRALLWRGATRPISI
jgi:hypothetical protein